MNILDLIQQNLQGPALDLITQQIGAKDSNQTKKAGFDISKLLMAGLAANAAKKGINGIFNALNNDHDGGILENITDFVKGSSNQSSKATDGLGILNHILGPNQEKAAETVGKNNGMSVQSTMKLMAIIAPLVMAYLGRQKRQQGLDSSGLFGFLNNQKEEVVSSKQGGLAGSVLNSFFDSDGDGNITDDLAQKGLGMLGNLFNKK